MIRTIALLLFLLLNSVAIPFIDRALIASPTQRALPVVLLQGSSVRPADSGMDVAEDSAGDWTWRDVQSGLHDPAFKTFKGGEPNFGFTDSVYWVRFSLEEESTVPTNREEHRNSWILEMSNPGLEFLDLLLVDSRDGHILKESHVGNFPRRTREIEEAGYAFFLPSLHGPARLYMRMKTPHVMRIPLHFYRESRFLRTGEKVRYGYGFYYGVVAVMLLYNLFLFLGIRDRTYLYYTIYILSYILLQLQLDGLAYQFFWPEHPLWNLHAQLLLSGMATVVMIQFGRIFLSVGDFYPRLDRLLLGLMAFSLVLSISAYYDPLRLAMFRLLGLVLIVYSILIMFIAVGMLRRGLRQSRTFLLAWSALLAGITVDILKVYGVIPFNLFTNQAMRVGSGLEVVLLSFALADRIAVLQKEKREQGEILVRQSRLASMGEMINVIAHQWKQPLTILSFLLQDLEESSELDILNKEYVANLLDSANKQVNYMNHTVDDFRNFFRPEQNRRPFALKEAIDETLRLVSFQFNRHGVELSVDAIPGYNPIVMGFPNGLKQAIINLLNNSLDAILDNRNPQKREQEYNRTSDAMGGRVRLHIGPSTEERCAIQIADNGGGIPGPVMERLFQPYNSSKEAKGTGIGLYITKTIIEKNMNGRISVTNGNEGAEFLIDLPVLKDADMNVR